MMTILSIVGARPQFIKLAPLSKSFEGSFREIIVHTGQHYDYSMSEQIFKDLGIKDPDYHLGVGSGKHAEQTGKMMALLEEVMLRESPDLVIVFGDTNSTLAGAITAAKLNIRLLHIEAGLRSYNRQMPEEVNRIVADHTSDHLFAPTENAMQILALEGLKDRSMMTGDIMVDTLTGNLAIAEEKSGILEKLSLKPGAFNLLTLHRGYNVDDSTRLSALLEELDSLPETTVFPVHPRTRNRIEEHNLHTGNILLTEPLSYLDFILLQKHAMRVLTDSGGVQKEAFILQKPCVTLRSETEWTETVESGWNLLLDPESGNLAERITKFEVPASQEPVFGENVTDKMFGEIAGIMKMKK